LLKSYGIYENQSTLTEEDFDPSIGNNDFGVKSRISEKKYPVKYQC
jgi:electron transfer flavoprotein alpha subunit